MPSVCRELDGSAKSLDTTETERFCRMFDRFFDCLNTRCIQEVQQKRKADLQPYYSSSDSRLKALGA